MVLAQNVIQPITLVLRSMIGIYFFLERIVVCFTYLDGSSIITVHAKYAFFFFANQKMFTTTFSLSFCFELYQLNFLVVRTHASQTGKWCVFCKKKNYTKVSLKYHINQFFKKKP